MYTPVKFIRSLCRELKPNFQRPKARLTFIVGILSQYLVLLPTAYLVVGRVSSDGMLEALKDRLTWFFGRRKQVQVLIQIDGVWRKLSVGGDAVIDAGSAGLLTRVAAVLFGRILVLDFGPRWLRWEARLRNKIYTVNWYQDFRESTWRFVSCNSHRPLSLQLRTHERQDLRPRTKECVVLGNGPSAINIFNPEFESKDVIICNSAIKSDRLLARRIVALCFADPVYYFGPCDYTRAFHHRLGEVVRDSTFGIYLDAEHRSFLQQRIPAIPDDRLYPVWMNYGLRYQPNFKRGRVQTTTASVFTTLMLPLAATHYEKIHLLGFDGKGPAVSNYFWRHNAEFQYTDLIATVQASDPGFFSVDYNQYSRDHAVEVEACLAAVEAMGTQVIMTHPSFIAPLQRRYESRPVMARNSLQS
jgi:hypothetical protein